MKTGVRKKLVFIVCLILIIFISQFILARKHLDFGFNSDDWNALARYKHTVENPILDIAKAWKSYGPHDTVHVYYIGLLFDLFQYNFFYYHLVNTIFKSLAVLSFFPVVYTLFKSRLLAFLSTIIFAFHPSPFGVIYHVIGGEGSLVVTFMNLFLALYIYTSQKHILNKLKILFTQFLLLGLVIVSEIPRSYPLILLLPILELINFFINKQSTTLKAVFLRLLLFYTPFIALIIYHPSALREFNYNKLIRIIEMGDYHLFLTIFSSFGSIFAPEGLIDQLNLFSRGQEPIYKNLETFLNFLFSKFLIISIPVLVIMGSLTDLKTRWILTTLLLTISSQIIAFSLANHWLSIDPKFRTPVDLSIYFIPGLVGLFIFSITVSFFISWLKNKRRNPLLLALSLIPVFSIIYIFLTWIMIQDDNSVFMGVHAYLNIPALGSSLYLAIILYMAIHKLSPNAGMLKRIIATLTLVYFFVFLIFSAQQVNKFFSYWLNIGFAAKDQERLQDSFWKEVGPGKSKDKNPILIYLDYSQDKVNEYFYSNSIIWSVPAMLTMGKGQPFDLGTYCKSVVSSNDIDKLRTENIDGKKMIVQNSCGPDLFYKPENFFAFKMINRDLIPIKSEILQKLEDE